jgi:AcrR family transcriptional regulator
VYSQSKTKRVQPSLRSEQRELTRARLRKAARTLFEDRGFADTSIDDIASAANVARPTVYLHYQSKEAIVIDLLEEDWQAQARHFERLAAASEAHASTLRQWIRRLTRAHQARRKSAAIYGSSLYKDPAFGARYKQYREYLIGILARRYPSFAAAQDNERVNAAAHCLLLQLDQFFWVMGQGHFDHVEPAIELMSDLFADFLFRGGPPALSPTVCFPTYKRLGERGLTE